ncbi:hypothetical protein [Streptomyces sp. NPDC046631]
MTEPALEVSGLKEHFGGPAAVDDPARADRRGRSQVGIVRRMNPCLPS